MEQYPPSNPAITWWLADYTHFICDQLGLPHEQGDQLFQHYHWLTTGIPPPQPASSQYGYPTAYPEIPDSHYPSPLQEQSPSAVFEDGLRSSPMSNSGFLNLSHGHFLEEEINYLADHTAMTASKIAPSELFSPYDQQPSQINSDSDFPETISPSMHSIGPSTHTPIGSVADYDPLWVQHCNINPNRVNNHRTSMKFDTLFTHNVLKLGDILTFQVAITTNRHTIQTEAHLQITSSSKAPHRSGSFPDLTITLPSDPHAHFPPAKSCKGTTAIIDHLERTCKITVVASAWQYIQVIRNEQALGNLRYFTKAFHLWRDWKDQEARETGQFFRPRRAQRVRDAANPVVHHKGRFGVWQEGVFVPDPDQGQFRANG